MREGEPAWVLFDGECGFCDRWVRWLLARDRRGRYRFGALQGEAAAAVRARHPDLPPADESLVLVEAPGTPHERVRVRSDGALSILAGLGGLYRLAAFGYLAPRPVRDAFYGSVARRRKRFLGRLESCRVPTAAERGRFLDGGG